MYTPDYIERTNRRTLSLSVLKDGTVVVKAPLKLRDEAIGRFVESKQDWIREKLMLVNRSRSELEDVLTYRRFLLYGNRYSLLLDNVKKIEINDKFQIVMPQKTEKERILGSLKVWYKRTAKQILSDRTAFIEGKIKLKSAAIKIGDSSGRWGACNSRGVICFNFRVIMLPPDLIDYIIVHELCHLVEMNHSKNFWSLVTSFLPNVEVLKRQLKKYSCLLSTFSK